MARPSGHGRHEVNAARPYARSARSTAPAGPLRGSERQGDQPSPLLGRVHRELIDGFDGFIPAHLGPFRDVVELFGTIAGSARWPRCTVCELGIDISRFPTSGHLISCAGICPRNDECAGKRRSNRLREDAPWLATTPVQCAWAAVRREGGHLCPVPKNPSPSRNEKVPWRWAASILTAACHMLRDVTPTAIAAPDTSNNATAKRGQATHRTPSQPRISRPDHTEPDMIKYRASSERKDGLALVAARPLSVSRNSLDRRPTACGESPAQRRGRRAPSSAAYQRCEGEE